MVDDYEKMVEYAKLNTSISENVDWNKVQEFVIDINRRSI
jgi:hypothetical protein